MKFNLENRYTVEIKAEDDTGDKTYEALTLLTIHLYKVRDYYEAVGYIATAEAVNQTIKSLNSALDIEKAKRFGF